MKLSGTFNAGAGGLILPNFSCLKVRCQSWLPNCGQWQNREVSSQDALSSWFETPSLPSFWSGWWRRVKALPWDMGVCKHTRQCQCCSPSSSSLLLNKSCSLCLQLPSLSELKAEVESYTNLWAGARMSHPVDSLGAETSRHTLLQVHLLHTPLCLHTPGIKQGFLWAVILPFSCILRKYFCFLRIITCKPCKGSENST